MFAYGSPDEGIWEYMCTHNIAVCTSNGALVRAHLVDVTNLIHVF